jgi:hypothetical protein
MPSQPQPRAADLSEANATVERRRAPRFDSDLQTTCRPLTARDGTSWPAQVLDISQSGIALLLTRRFERGALLTMELVDAQQSTQRSCFARVIHVHAHETGGWRHGCAFSGELSDEELAAFRAERVAASDTDCRAWVRFECDVPTMCREADGSASEPTPGRILNIAPGGVGLLVGTAYPERTLLWLQLPDSPQRQGRKVLVRVVQLARPVDDQWLLGCEFAFQLGEQDLQQLLR